MCWALALLAFIVFGGTALSFAETSANLKALSPRVEIVASVGGNSVTFRLSQAITSGLVKSSIAKVQPGDTLGSLLINNGFRFDPVSVRLVYELNPTLRDAEHLKVNKIIHLPNMASPRYSPHFRNVILKMDQDVKQDLNSLNRLIARQSSGVMAWADHWAGKESVLHVKTMFQETITNMNRLKIADYALPRETLVSTRKGMRAFNSIVTEMIKKNQIPDSAQVRFFSAVKYNVGRLATAARNTSKNRVPVEVATYLSDGTPQPWLYICYRYEIEYLYFKAINPNSEPRWSCTRQFGTPTTPAKDMLHWGHRFVIWADRMGSRVSKFAVIDVEPNTPEGRYTQTLIVK